jgi:RepB DNA-primase from phage plasmid
LTIPARQEKQIALPGVRPYSFARIEQRGGAMAELTGSTAQSQAQQMLDAFASVGVQQFDITHTNIDQERRGYRRAQSLRQAKTSMPYLLDSAPRRQNNVILRPHHPPAVVLVQLDDLKQEQLERVRPAAFLILQTSPGNHQAWIAVEDGDREFSSRLKKGTGADLTASGSVRVAGTFNFKRKYAPNFPMVAIDEAHPGRIVTRAELEGRGLAAPAPPKPEAPASPLRCSDRPRRLAWPDWNLCLEQMLSKGLKRSAADFYFACMAIDRYKRTPEETADRLMEVSPKAQENGHDYALGQAINAAAKVAANPRSPAR